MIFTLLFSLYFFRIVFDRETGKPKGFGFCEYRDAEAAQSAIRNLHGVDLNGRPLRVSIADPSLQPSEFGGGMTPGHIFYALPLQSIFSLSILYIY